MSRLTAGKFDLDLSIPRIMGVVNVTPDSFSDGGRYASSEMAIRHGLALAGQGADILDVGGESTRPGAIPVSVEEELDRVVPVVEALAGHGLFVSVDTRRPEVMRQAIAAGAAMINDVMALREPGALEAVAGTDVAVCLMHMQGEPQTMQTHPVYADVVMDVYGFLRDRLSACQSAGLDRSRLLVDPGFGFGKTLAHNLALLKNLQHLSALEVPILVGMSRKSMLGLLTGRAVHEREYAGVAAHLAAVVKGANILRVHDVVAMKDALTVWRAIEQGEQAG